LNDILYFSCFFFCFLLFYLIFVRFVEIIPAKPCHTAIPDTHTKGRIRMDPPLFLSGKS